jgi:Cytidylyltransferase family.
LDKALKGEIFRKTIHILAYPYAVLLFSAKEDIISLFGLTFLIVLVDFLRIKFKPLNRLIFLLWGKSIRAHERRNLSDASVMAFGIFINVLIFGKCALVGLAISIIGDAFSALFGKVFGKRRLKNGKSIEGFIAFNLAVFILAILSGDMFLPVLLAGFITSIFELFSVPLENLTLGLISSSTFFILQRTFWNNYTLHPL